MAREASASLAGIVPGLLVGALVAVCGTAVHRLVWRDGPLPVPWGVCLALLALTLSVHAAGMLAGPPALLAVRAGWLLTSWWVQSPGPGGDLLVLADPLGYAWFYGGLVAVALGALLGVARDRLAPARAAPTRDGPARTQPRGRSVR